MMFNKTVRPKQSEKTVANVLQERGLTAEDFKNLTTLTYCPTVYFEGFYDAFKLVSKAVEHRWTTAVHYDGDVDGIISGFIATSILIRFNLKNLKLFNKTKIHGVTSDTLKECLDGNVKLLICVDSSTNSTSLIRELLINGVSVIIIDHHEVTDAATLFEVNKLKEEFTNFVLINNTLDTAYTSRMKDTTIDASELSAGMLVYYFSELISKHYFQMTDLFDYGAITIRSDIRSVSNNLNRAIVNKLFSQKVYNRLIKAFAYEGVVTVTTFDYGVAPAINSLIRLNRTEDAIALLFAKDGNEFTAAVEKANEAKKTQTALVNKIMTELHTNIDTQEKKIFNLKQIVFGIIETIDLGEFNEAKRNFTGLIATKLKAKYNKPAFVITTYDDLVKGSFRGFSGDYRTLFNSHGLLAEGHKNACGITIQKDKFNDKFQTLLHTFPESNPDVCEVELNIVDLPLNATLIESIAKFNVYSGQGVPPIKIKLHFEPLDVEIKKISSINKLYYNGIEIIAFGNVSSPLNVMPLYTTKLELMAE